MEYLSPFTVAKMANRSRKTTEKAKESEKGFFQNMYKKQDTTKVVKNTVDYAEEAGKYHLFSSSKCKNFF